MLEQILRLDAGVSTLIRDMLPHNVIFDYFFAFLSVKGNSIVIWAIIIALLWLLESKKDKIFIWYFSASFAVTYVVNNFILKNLFFRHRPVAPEIHSILTCPTDFSFPSGHAAGAFAGAVILAHFDRKRAWAYYVIASLVALSRIYFGCHYLLDVLGGALVGAAISHIALQVHKRRAPKEGHVSRK